MRALRAFFPAVLFLAAANGAGAADMCGPAGAAALIASDPVNFRDAYYDFDVRARAFIGAFDPEDAARLEGETRAARYGFLHEGAEDLLARLAVLLPMSAGEGEKSPAAFLEEQLYAGEVWDQSDDPKEIQRIAFARELLAVAPDAGRKAGQFVVHLDMARSLIAAHAAGEESETDRGALVQLAPALEKSYKEGFRPVVKEAVFASKPARLDARLAARIEAMCEARRAEGQ